MEEAFKFLTKMLNIPQKKGQSAALISGLVFGIATLVVAVIVAFIIVSNIGTIDDDVYVTLAGPGADNESVTGLAEAGDALTYNYLNGCAATVSTVYNTSDDEIILATDNYTVTGCTIYGVAASPFLTYDVGVTYTTTYHATEETADNMMGNFTSGIDNVSGKIPTVLLVAAIVLVLGLLVLIVGAWQRMSVGGGI